MEALREGEHDRTFEVRERVRDLAMRVRKVNEREDSLVWHLMRRCCDEVGGERDTDARRRVDVELHDLRAEDR